MNHFPKYLVLLILLSNVGCVSPVAPWERGTLAKPTMALEPDVLDATLARHAHGSKEAATGGYGVGGGGCGCN